MIRHDTTHDMYLPDKRARKERVPPSWRRAAPRNATTEEEQAWMRERQAAKPHPNLGRKMPRADKHHPNSAINQLMAIEKRRAELNAPDLSGEWAI